MDYIAYKGRLLTYRIVVMRGYVIAYVGDMIVVHLKGTPIYRTQFIMHAYQFVQQCEEIAA